MAPSSTLTLLSPAELSFLHNSLSLSPPIRPDGRSPTQFRPLIAETEILPNTNGSARICFADGTEAIVGIKAEVEKTKLRDEAAITDYEHAAASNKISSDGVSGHRKWIDMAIEIPGYRDDDALPVYLAAMLNEALGATSDLADKLFINSRFHWRLYIDVLLLSPPLSYPIPLLSLTTVLALLSTRLPALVSEGTEDPLFNDDWDASLPLYPRGLPECPPITLLVVCIGSNILFDPSREELAVANAVLAVSIATLRESSAAVNERESRPDLKLVAIRTVDPPSRLTSAGMADGVNGIAGGKSLPMQSRSNEAKEGVWRPPLGGMKRDLISRVAAMCLVEGGAGQEILDGLRGLSI